MEAFYQQIMDHIKSLGYQAGKPKMCDKFTQIEVDSDSDEGEISKY